MITLTSEQQNAHDTVMDWLKTGRKCLTLGGYAGTGKTTVVAKIAATMKAQGLRLAFCTVSAKASTVLRSKLREVLTEADYCGTIHGIIYLLVGKKTLHNGRNEPVFSAKDIKLPFDVLIVDEASMVNEYIFRDLSAHGIPILAVGDHGQLPPVKGNFNLMANPEIKLETIMRQAENNPIIKMALMARLDGVIKYGDYGHGCIKTRDTKFLHSHDYANPNSIMICALNKTRVRMNTFARDILKRDSIIPQPGEPLICLYNNHRKFIYNGTIGILKNIETSQIHGIQTYFVSIDTGEEFLFNNHIEPAQFGKEYISVDDKDDDLDFFDWAYAITCHKAQGSEWQNVLVMEEGEFMFHNGNWNKWLYTAVSRGKERVIIYKR